MKLYNTPKANYLMNKVLLGSAIALLFSFLTISAVGEEYLRVYTSAPTVMVSDVTGGSTLVEDFNSFTGVPNNNWAPLPNGYNSAIGLYTQTTGQSSVKSDDQYGAGTGQYMAIQTGADVRLVFDNPVRYFAFAWPAGDGQNNIKIIRDGQIIGTFETADVIALLPKDQNNFITAINSSQYSTYDYYGKPGTGQNSNEPYAFLHYVASEGLAFDEIIFDMGTGGAFENDNHTLLIGVPVIQGGWVELISIETPTANDDSSIGLPGIPVEIDVLDNDVPGDAALDPSTVQIAGTNNPGDPLVVSGEGTWSVNTSTGAITFTPESGFLSSPTPIEYSVLDVDNYASNLATVTITVTSGTTNYYPATGFGTLAFEDLWPGKGDYDFNDLVLDYRFEITTTTSNYVENVTATFIIKAIGASLQNGFGFQLASAINASDLTVTGYSLTESIITLGGNGTEDAQTNPTIIVFDNAYNEMTHPGGGIGINTSESAPYVTPVTLTINIVFTPNTYTYNDLDISNFNPFIFVNLDRTVEVHLPDYPPTDLADQSLFGTANDDSDAGTGKYYKTANNLPWAINLYESFDYPAEKQQVVWAYLHFAEWATSNGTSYQDWYQDLQGNRNDALIYTAPPSK